MSSVAFYAASKAAVRTYSETLRLELAPLGVKVMTVMTGLVTSQIFDNGQQNDLAETSYYTPAAAEIASLASGRTVMPHAMSPAVYAQRVVDDAIGGRSGVRWRGNMASVVWLFSWLFPTWLKVSLPRILFISTCECGLIKMRRTLCLFPPVD